MSKDLQMVTVNGVKLDVHFDYIGDSVFEVDTIEDIVSTQDLTPILSESVLIKIEEELKEIYRKNGWL